MTVYWTCFAYEGMHPKDLHCTHKYLGEQSGPHVWDIHEILSFYFYNHTYQVPVVNFNEIQWFDHHRVLLPSEPVSLFPILRKMLDDYRDDDFPYNPHVTCYDEDEINHPFTRYCLMKDCEIITQWGLP
jgi:hypothetical protein